jgi:hypothetical protein
VEYGCHAIKLCAEIDPMEAAFKIKQTSKNIVTLFSLYMLFLNVGGYHIPQCGIRNKLSDYIKICQRLTNLVWNVGLNTIGINSKSNKSLREQRSILRPRGDMLFSIES